MGMISEGHLVAAIVAVVVLVIGGVIYLIKNR